MKAQVFYLDKYSKKESFEVDCISAGMNKDSITIQVPRYEDDNWNTLAAFGFTQLNEVFPTILTRVLVSTGPIIDEELISIVIR